jgi:hypothetical protein
VKWSTLLALYPTRQSLCSKVANVITGDDRRHSVARHEHLVSLEAVANSHSPAAVPAQPDVIAITTPSAANLAWQAYGVEVNGTPIRAWPFVKPDLCQPQSRQPSIGVDLALGLVDARAAILSEKRALGPIGKKLWRSASPSSVGSALA